jgi:phosphatidate cytidylyltransferase
LSDASGGSNLTHRVLSACVFVPLVLGLTYVGGWARFALVAGIVGRGSWELLYLARQAGHRPASVAGVVLSLAACCYLQLRGADEGFPLLLTLSILLSLALSLRHGVQGYLFNALLTMGVVGYIGLLGSTPLLLAGHLGELAPILLIAIFGSIWLTDAAAYAGGRMWGDRRLAPTISPGKTVVGFVCGLVGGLIPVLLYRFVPTWSPVELAGLFLLVSASSQLGDLVESAIKRDLGVKDAPAFIPGHGGLLDRFDSYFFAFPVAFAYTVILKSFGS